MNPLIKERLGFSGHITSALESLYPKRGKDTPIA